MQKTVVVHVAASAVASGAEEDMQRAACLPQA